MAYSYWDKYRPKSTPSKGRTTPSSRPRQYNQPAAKGRTVPQNRNWLSRFSRGITQTARKYNQLANQGIDKLKAAGKAVQDATPAERVAGIRSWGAKSRQPAPPAEREGRFGVHYGPNWERSDWTPPPDWRSGKFANIQMTPDEYIRRRNALEPTLQSDTMNTPRQYQQYTGDSYLNWYSRAQRTPGVAHDLDSQWRAQNPKPTGFFQTDQEWIVRNNAAPTGYTYMPFGSSYVKNPTLPSMGAGASKSNNQGGGGYGWDYGGWGGGGGGGGGYSKPADEFYNLLTNWRILQVQGG